MKVRVDIEIHEYDWHELIDKLCNTFTEIDDVDALKKILLAFGFRYGDKYIILNNEYHGNGEYSSYYNVARFIDDYFSINPDDGGANDDTFEIICEMGTTLNSSRTKADVAKELGLKIIRC